MQSQAAKTKKTIQNRTAFLLSAAAVAVPLSAGVANAATIPSNVFALQVNKTTLEDGHQLRSGSVLTFSTISVQNGSPQALAIGGANAFVRNVTLKDGKVVSASIDITRGNATDHFALTGGKAIVSLHNRADAASDAVTAERAIDAITSTYGQFTGKPVASVLGHVAVASRLIEAPVVVKAPKPAVAVPMVTVAQEDAAIASAVAKQKKVDDAALLQAVTAQLNKDVAVTQAAVSAQAGKDATAAKVALAAQAKTDAARQQVAVQAATLGGMIKGVVSVLVVLAIGAIGYKGARWLHNRGKRIQAQLQAEDAAKTGATPTPTPVEPAGIADGSAGGPTAG